MSYSVRLTGYGLYDRVIVVLFSAQAKDFSLLHTVQTGCVTNSAFCPMGIVPTAIKQPLRECASEADVKNECSYTSTPAMCLHIVHRYTHHSSPTLT
jgi:hypothetical protein